MSSLPSRSAPADAVELRAQLRSAARDFLSRTSPESEVRRLMATAPGHDPKVWKRMAGELGWLGLAVPERFGGAGFGLAELAVVFEEMGRVLLPAPFFSTAALATTALLEARDDDATAEYLPRIVAGELLATMVLDDGCGTPPVEARRDGRGWTLSGTAPFVPDGLTAGLVLVPAPVDGALSLFAVELGGPSAGSVQRTAMTTMDGTRKQAVVRFLDTPGRPVGVLGAATPLVERSVTGPWWPWPPSRWVGLPAAWRCRWITPRRGCSSTGPSDPSRRSSTGARTCW